MVQPTYRYAVATQPLGQCATVAPPTEQCADVATAEWQGTTMVPPTRKCTIAPRPLGQCADVAPTRQPCAVMAPAQWQHTTIGPPTYTSAIKPQVCTCPSADRETSCRGDMTLAVLTASRVVGSARRLAQPSDGRAPAQWQNIAVVPPR